LAGRIVYIEILQSVLKKVFDSTGIEDFLSLQLPHRAATHRFLKPTSPRWVPGHSLLTSAKNGMSSTKWT